MSLAANETAAGNSGSAGGDGAVDEPVAGWTCVQFGESCICVESGAGATDTCTSPKPPCCYILSSIGAANCECSPPDSQDCATTGGDPEAMRVPACPPG